MGVIGFDSQGLAQIFFGLSPTAAAVVAVTHVVEQVGIARRLFKGLVIFLLGLLKIALAIVEDGQAAANATFGIVLACPFVKGNGLGFAAVFLQFFGTGDAGARGILGRQFRRRRRLSFAIGNRDQLRSRRDMAFPQRR